MYDILNIHHLICDLTEFYHFSFDLLLTGKSYFMVMITDRTADIFDHILAIIPEFGLRVYQQPSGADLQSLSRLQ